MASRIPRPFVDEVLARTDLIALIQEHGVVLRKSGRDFNGLCPFHGEKTPSFHVSPEKQFYHCFGCQASGNAISFLIDHARYDFPSAVRSLAERVGLALPQEEDDGPDLSPLYALLGEVAHWYAEQLRHHPEARRAVDYLKGRGVSGEMAKAFLLGYAPPGWNNLGAALGQGTERIQRLTELGLLVPRTEGKGKGHYDRFRDRIMFPIRDRRGRVLGFGARLISPEDQGAKYLNSPSSAVFQKGAELYGLYEAIRAEGRLERLLVVEGYLDVVSLAQHGIPQVVAALGTALTEGHVQALFRQANELIFCFDGDEAGRRAARRALDHCLPALSEGRSVGFLPLPAGEDPDSYVRRAGPAPFTTREAVVPLSDLFLDGLRAGLDLDTAEGQARLVELARPQLARIPSLPFRQALASRVGEIARLPVDPGGAGPLEGGGERASPASSASPSAAPPPPPKPVPRRRGPIRLVEQIVHLLLHHPLLGIQHRDRIAALIATGIPGGDLVTALLAEIARDPTRPGGILIEYWRGEPAEARLKRLLEQEQLIPGEGIEGEFQSLLQRLEDRLERRRREALLPQEGIATLDEGQKAELRAHYVRLRERKRPPSGKP
jgi:DNA primase